MGAPWVGRGTRLCAPVTSEKDLSIPSVITKSVVHVPSCTCKGKGLLLHLYVRWGPLIRGLRICAFECTMRYGIMLLAEQSFVLLYCISGLHDAFCDKPGSGFLGCASQKWLADTQKALQCKGRGGYYFLNDFNFFLKNNAFKRDSTTCGYQYPLGGDGTNPPLILRNYLDLGLE